MPAADHTVAFLFPAFPVLHQTFVLWEVLALRQQGIAIELYSLKQPRTQTQQPEGAVLAAEVRCLPPTFSRQVIAANLQVCVRAPLRYVGVFARLVREWWKDRDARSLWRNPASAADARAGTLPLRQRPRAFFNRSQCSYLLKSLWLVPRAVHLGCELRQAGIHRLHAHWASYPTTVALVIHWLFDIPFSFSAHAYDIYLVPRLLSVKVREAEFAVTCAGINARYLEKLAGGSGKVVLNYHGVDLERFRLRAPATAAVVPCIVTCGRLQRYKGHNVLLQACARLRRPFRCVLIGEGVQRQQLEKLAASLGISDQVELTGPLPQAQVVRRYAEATVFVLASVVIERSGRRDVIPNVLAEAMAMGIPVVATDVGGIRELVTDGVSGRLVKSKDPEALARVLEELLDDEAQRQRLGLGGHRKVSQDFDRSRNIVTLAQLFRVAPAGSRAAAGAPRTNESTCGGSPPADTSPLASV